LNSAHTNRLVELLHWLKIDSGSSGRRAHPAIPGTGQWLFQSQSFKSWMEASQSSIFWISGKPGSGKTVLSDIIIEILQNEIVDISQNIVAYFYFDWSQGTVHTTAGAILRSLIVQILSQVPSAMSDFIPLYSQQGDFSTKSDESDISHRPWMSKELTGLFEESLLKFSKAHRFFIVIDALDECPPENAPGVLSLLRLLTSRGPDSEIKVCITSRPHLYMDENYRTWHQKIHLEHENMTDIRRYVESTLARHQKWTLWGKELIHI